MSYKINRTDKANEQLRDIIFYRTEVTGRVEAGLDLLSAFEISIKQLEVFPEIGHKPRYTALSKRGFRVLVIDKYLIFYKVDHKHKLVTIAAIVDGKRDYINLI